MTTDKKPGGRQTGQAKRAMVEMAFKVQTYDIDFGGIVNNIVYIRWLEDLRLKILETWAPLERELKNGQGPVLLETHIIYHQPVRILERPVGRMWLAKVSGARWHVEAEFHVGERLVCSARQNGAYVDLRTGRPVRLPPGLRRAAADGDGKGA